MTGSKKTHQEARRRLRHSLAARGVPADEIERQVSALRERQHAARTNARSTAAPGRPVRNRDVYDLTERQRQIAAERRREVEAETYARLAPDDSRFRPARPDPLTVGPARVTGIAAKIMKRGKTVTRFDYDQAEAQP